MPEHGPNAEQELHLMMDSLIQGAVDRMVIYSSAALLYISDFGNEPPFAQDLIKLATVYYDELKFLGQGELAQEEAKKVLQKFNPKGSDIHGS